MMDNNSPGEFRGKSLQAMTTEELEELLRQEQNADGMPDVDCIKAIVATLEAREEAPHVDIDAAWDDFMENYIFGEPLYQMPTEETSKPQPNVATRKKPLVRIVVIAAVLLVVVIGLTITASATGFKLWNIFIEWTSETFGIRFRENIDEPYGWNPELLDLHVAIARIDSEIHLVPHYLPDGYKQVFLNADDNAIVAQYEAVEQSIFIQLFRIEKDYGEQFQRDDSLTEHYIANGIDHLISTNRGQYLATWTNEEWECSILCVPSKQELLRMIDSIYLEE